MTEIEAALLPKPAGVLSGIVFFKDEGALLAFVREARRRSLQTRTAQNGEAFEARALEYFDAESLGFLRGKYALVPLQATGAIFLEQETTPQTEDHLLNEWLMLLQQHDALLDDSWFATEEKDQERIREFRHQLPVLINEWLAHHQQRKVSTDRPCPTSLSPTCWASTKRPYARAAFSM